MLSGVWLNNTLFQDFSLMNYFHHNAIEDTKNKIHQIPNLSSSSSSYRAMHFFSLVQLTL